jgi:hypothetical protein
MKSNHGQAVQSRRARWFIKSPMVQNDAALSVLRSFKRRDWNSIFEEAGLGKVEIHWRWAFRWQICVYV